MSTDWSGRVRGAEHFTAAYDTQPPWDTGRPQAALAAAAERGLFAGHVLDAGCGTGEHALLAASRGLPATGVDIVPEAIRQAREKAEQRGLDVRFEVGDARDLQALGETYDTVVDCGLFHVLDDEDVTAYVDGLRAVVRPGGRMLLLCFSDAQPGEGGPRRVPKSAITDAFADGWEVEAIDEAGIEVAYGYDDLVRAWLATIRRS